MSLHPNQQAGADPSDSIVFPSVSTEGAGSKILIDPAQGSVRGGTVSGTQWDEALRGVSSVAFGLDTIASGIATLSLGTGSTASHDGSFVWSSRTPRASSADDEVTFGADGGFKVLGNGAGIPAYVDGQVYLDATETVVTGKLTVAGLIDPTGLQCTEQINNPGVVAATFGTYWVRNDAPNTPVFTASDGIDYVLNSPGGAGAFENTPGGLTWSTSTAPNYAITNSLVYGSTSMNFVDLASQCRLEFDKPRGAFRAGCAQTSQWDTINRGVNSVAFGQDGIASGTYSAIGGGLTNTASGIASSVVGGDNNVASGDWSTVCGGRNNTAQAVSSWAGGDGATITSTHSNSLVWAGGVATSSTGANEVSIRASGGFRVLGTGSGIPAYVPGSNVMYLDSASTILTGDLDVSGLIDMATGLQLSAQSVNPSTPTLTNGTFWVRSGVPTQAFFTDSTGTDHHLLEPGVFSNLGGPTGPTAPDVLAPNYNLGANDFVFGSQELGDSGAMGVDRFLFDKAKGAFRAGTANSAEWDIRGPQSVAFGLNGVASQPQATVGGGVTNSSIAAQATVAGGDSNTASGVASTVSGGISNSAIGATSVVAGGTGNIATFANSIVSGGTGNSATAIAATVSGGSANTASSADSGVSAGHTNMASGDASYIGGGFANLASGVRSVVSGGSNNVATNIHAGVASGSANQALGVNGFVGGGLNNIVAGSATSGTIVGGDSNTVSAAETSIGGGSGNTASGLQANVSGGLMNMASGVTSTVGGGTGHVAAAQFSTIAGGSTNNVTIAGTRGTIGGGISNTVTGVGGTIPGGTGNTAVGIDSLAAGENATSTHDNTFVWAGSIMQSSFQADEVTFGAIGGFRVLGNGNGAVAYLPGSVYLDATVTQLTGEMRGASGLQVTQQIIEPSLPGAANGTFWVRNTVPNTPFFTDGAGTQHNLLNGVFENTDDGVVRSNTLTASYGVNNNYVFGSQQLDDVGNVTEDQRVMFDKLKGAFRAGSVKGTQWDGASRGLNSVAFGLNSTASGAQSSVGGGDTCQAQGQYATVTGGQNNTASGTGGWVGGGHTCVASQTQAVCCGGNNNIASGITSSVGGGQNNIASGTNATVPGGTGCVASGNQSCAIGLNCTSSGVTSVAMGVDCVSDAAGTVCLGTSSDTNGNDGTIVLSDGNGVTALTAVPNALYAGFAGGSTFYSDIGRTTGVNLGSGLSAWAAVSDRNAKENLKPFVRVLERLDRIPIYEYNYLGQSPNRVCRGPMAQDWHAQFVSDKDPLRIDTMDLDGVALAAIKELITEVRDLRAEIMSLKRVM
jgi:hypothetical protein